MDFAEIAFQNVAGFPATGRFPLANGLNAFVSPETDLFLVWRALFGPLSDDISALRGVSGPRKLALTIHGDDGHSYRLVRDLDGGRVLLRADPVTRKPVKLSDDADEIARVLLEVAGVPGIQLLQHHLWLAQADLPSRAGTRTSRSGSELLPAATTAENPGISPEEARRRLPELQAELQRAQQFEQAQDSLYELQLQLAELNKAAAPFLDLEKQVLELTARGDAHRKLNEITSGLEARIKKFPEVLARRDGALVELQKKRNEYEQSLAQLPEPPPLLKEQLVLGGLAAGGACIVAAFIFGGAYPWLWAADILGFGVAAFGAWRWVDKVEGDEGARRRMLDLQDLEKRIHKQFEVDTAPLYAAMNALRVATPDDVLAKLEERDLVEARRVAAMRELEQRRSDPQFAALDAQRRHLEEEVRAREAYIQTMGFTRESATILRDVTACEQALNAGGADPAEPLWAALDAAARFAGGDPRALLDSTRERLGQYLSALTDRRFIGVRLVGPSLCHVVAATGAGGPLSGLPPTDRDLVYVGLRLALAEKVAAPAKRPLLVDEPSVLVDVSHRALLVKMLKALGSMTQVVVRAFDAPPAGIVDHIARAGMAA